MDYQHKLLTKAGLPTPQELLNQNIKLEIGAGEVWTTIISISTIANDDGYPELGVAPALFRGNTIIGVQVREEERFFVRYNFWLNGVEFSELNPCKLTLL